MSGSARTGLVVLLAVALTACGGGGGQPEAAPPAAPVVEASSEAESPSATESEAESEPAATSPEPAPVETPPPPPAVPDLAAVAVRLTPVATLDAPIAMTTRTGDDALYIAERAGLVRVLRGGQVEPAPLVDIVADTTIDGERGLLGLTFSPDGQRLYLYFTDPNGAIRIDEWTLDGAAVRPETRRTLLVQEHPRLNHNGGTITFGPDGLLYLGLGDGGGQGDPNRNAQNLGTLLGKVLRIDPRPAGDAPYGVPADNPFVGDPAARGEIWAYGMRNPWRFSFDRETGDLWVGDVGQDELEEVSLLAGGGRGADLGWSDYEGTQLYNGEAGADGLPPIHEYGREDGSSVTGGYVYRGQAIPALRGAYVFGDLRGPLWALHPSGGAVVGQIELGELDTLVSFGEDAAGELYALSLNGDVVRLDPA